MTVKSTQVAVKSTQKVIGEHGRRNGEGSRFGLWTGSRFGLWTLARQKTTLSSQVSPLAGASGNVASMRKPLAAAQTAVASVCTASAESL